MCTGSIEPFERSRPWFAADTGLMHIQLREGCGVEMPRSFAGIARQRATDAGVRGERLMNRDDMLCRTETVPVPKFQDDSGQLIIFSQKLPKLPSLSLASAKVCVCRT